jgi:hypothetical protein
VNSIGIGGTERWQVYPIVLWLAVYGGYLLASGHSMRLIHGGRANACSAC